MAKSTKQLSFGLMEMLADHEELSADETSHFMTLDRFTFEPHNACNLCQSNRSFIRYEVLGDCGVLVRAGCCLSCFPNLGQGTPVKFVAHFPNFPGPGPGSYNAWIVNGTRSPETNYEEGHTG